MLYSEIHHRFIHRSGCKKLPLNMIEKLGFDSDLLNYVDETNRNNEMYF